MGFRWEYTPGRTFGGPSNRTVLYIHPRLGYATKVHILKPAGLNVVKRQGLLLVLSSPAKICHSLMYFSWKHVLIW
jgi:hypothetical protein